MHPLGKWDPAPTLRDVITQVGRDVIAMRERVGGQLNLCVIGSWGVWVLHARQYKVSHPLVCDQTQAWHLHQAWHRSLDDVAWRFLRAAF